MWLTAAAPNGKWGYFHGGQIGAASPAPGGPGRHPHPTVGAIDGEGGLQDGHQDQAERPEKQAEKEPLPTATLFRTQGQPRRHADGGEHAVHGNDNVSHGPKST
jgi:hypothetical protein